MPLEQLFCLENIVKHLLCFVGALVVFWEAPVFSITVELIKSAQIEVLSPALGETSLITVQARRWKEDEHIEDHANEDKRAN